MGQHSAPQQPPPPKDKPRYRFLLAIAGIVLLAFIAMAIVAAIFPQRSPAVAGPNGAVTSANPFPPLPTVEPAAGSPTLTSPPARSGPKTNTKTTDPTSGAVTATYSAPSTDEWPTGFQASVTIHNTSASPQFWEVHLTYPSTVTKFDQTWIQGAQPPDVIDANLPEVVLRSLAQLAPGASVTVHLQFEKSGGGSAPSLRTVNGQTF